MRKKNGPPKSVVSVRVPKEVRSGLERLAGKQRPKQRLSDYLRVVLEDHVRERVA
jgi:hypothetical protein